MESENMPDKDHRIEPNGTPPYEHSFFKWGSTNPEMVEEANRLMQHRDQERVDEAIQAPSQQLPRCPKARNH